MRTAFTLALFALSTLPACGAAFVQPTPRGFVKLEDQKSYDYRAVSADGVVLAVRELDHEPRGELDFWSEAIANHLRQRGYALLETRDVKTEGGLAGKQLRFGHDEGRTPHLYFVTVFVTEDRLFLLEAGGTRDRVESHAAEIDWAVASFHAK